MILVVIDTLKSAVSDWDWTLIFECEGNQGSTLLLVTNLKIRK
jgi:hypothetical protein